MFNVEEKLKPNKLKTHMHQMFFSPPLTVEVRNYSVCLFPSCTEILNFVIYTNMSLYQM